MTSNKNKITEPRIFFVCFQSQFEDLQSECKKVRDDYNKLKKSINT